MELIIISPESGLEELEILPGIFKAGLQYYHLRKPDFNENDLRRYLFKVPQEFHSKIIIHSYYHLAGEFSLKGIHYPEALRRATQSFPSHRHISTSFHTVEELKQCPFKFDYAFLSPIFNSISKAGYQSPFDLKELKSHLAVINQKAIALGGIDEHNIGELKAAGFFGVALLGAVWQNKDPFKKFMTIQEIANAVKSNQT